MSSDNKKMIEKQIYSNGAHILKTRKNGEIGVFAVSSTGLLEMPTEIGNANDCQIVNSQR